MNEARNAVTAEPLRKSQINAEAESLSEAVEMLLDAVSSLERRLNSVTRSEPPEISTGKTVPTPVSSLVPFAETLRAQRERLDSGSQRIQSVLSRLEL